MVQTRRRRKQSTLKLESTAIAVFRTEQVEGEVLVKQTSSRLCQLTAFFTKLPPGKHGFHIHKAGDLRGEGCKGACAHYHIGSSSGQHGGPPGTDSERHTGDLGNIELPSSGRPLKKTYQLANVSVDDLWGRSIIVHADEDDLGQGRFEDSKITGHSGARIACAIFGRGMEC